MNNKVEVYEGDSCFVIRTVSSNETIGIVSATDPNLIGTIKMAVEDGYGRILDFPDVIDFEKILAGYPLQIKIQAPTIDYRDCWVDYSDVLIEISDSWFYHGKRIKLTRPKLPDNIS